MSTLSKYVVENDTPSFGLSSPSKSAREILVNADDIIENPPDLSDLAELEEEIEDASNQLLADYEHSEEQIACNWNARTSLVLDSSKDALAKRTLSGYKRYLLLLIYILIFKLILVNN
jgi:hypothetical protein